MKNLYARYLSPNEREALEIFKTSVKKLLVDSLREIQLFGSKVRGDFDKDSDIDVLIIIKAKDMKVEEQIFNLAADINLEHECNISPVIFSQEEYEKNRYFKTLFVQYIEKEGIPI